MLCVLSEGCGVLHPSTVGGWGSEPESSLLSSQLSAGQCLLALPALICSVVQTLTHERKAKKNKKNGPAEGSFLSYFMSVGSGKHQSGDSTV